MATTTKNNFQPTRRNNYKPVVMMANGGNVSELNYSERREYIEENYAPFITDAQMIFSIYDSGIEYDYKGDRKEVVNSIIESYKALGDYTETTLPQETIYEIQDWDLVRKEIDPDTDEVIGETSLEEVSADNTYNFSYLGLVDLNWRVYHDEEYDRFFYVITPHLGGDIRGNYGDAIILEGNDKEELFYRFYEGFIRGSATIYIKFKDGSEIGFDSEQDSDVFTFRLNEVFEPTGMAKKYLKDFEKFETWYGDEFLEETIDIYLARKGVVPKMMAGGSLNDETPMAYIQILGYDEGKYFNLTDYSDGQDVIDAIYDYMNELNKQFGGNREEYEVTDYEGFGDDLYDQYMGANEFDEIIEAYEKYESSDFSADVISAYKKESGSRNDTLSDVIDEMENNYFGKYNSLSDFGYEMVEQGVYTLSDSDVYITDTDKRILAGEESDNIVNEMSFDDLMNIASDTQSEYQYEKNELENKISEIQSEIDDLTDLQNSSDDDEYEKIGEQIEEKEIELDDVQSDLDNIGDNFEDKAREEAREQIYDEIYDKLENDLSSWLEENGLTSDLENISFLSVDYEKIGDELSSDYLIVEYDGEMYFFNNYKKGGRITASKRKPKFAYYIVENNTKKLVSGYTSKSDASEQRKLLVQQYPSMRFEIYTLGNLETKTNLDVYAKKDYVELSTLDKIKKVSVDAYRYGQEKVGQANAFLKKNDVKGRIQRGARNVADKSKQGLNYLRNKWLEADFGDGTGRAKFFADGGEIDNLKSDLNKYKNVDIRFKLIPNDGLEEDGDENDLSLNYVGEIYGGGIDSDEPFVELGFQVNDEADDSINLKSDLNKYKNLDIRFKLIPNDGSEEDGDENDLSLNYIGEIYGGGIDSDEPFVELGFQVNNKFLADGGMVGAEIEFNYYGEPRTGTIIEVLKNKYAVQSDMSQILVEQRDVIEIIKKKAPINEQIFDFFQNGGGVGEIKYDIIPKNDKFIIAKITNKKQEDNKYPSKEFIHNFNRELLEFNDMKSAQKFIENIELKNPYGIKKANAGMILLASELFNKQPQQQPQVVYYVPQPITQEEENTGIIQNIPEMANGGELEFDNELVNDFCITNLIELANEIQAVKYYVTDRFKETDFESKKYKARLVIVFKQSASVNVVNSITKFIERAKDCRHLFEQSVNVSGSKPNTVTINLLTDKFSDTEFSKGGKVYDYAPKKINIKKTNKITTNLGDYNLGLITKDFVYFVNSDEGDDNANVIMYKKNGELLSDNYFASQDLYEVLQNEDTFEFIHPDIEAYRQEILKQNL